MLETDKFRILVVDDNIEIHNDFIKILTKPYSNSSKLDELEKKIFGIGSGDLVTSIPEFVIDSTSCGEEGVKKVKQMLDSGNRYALAFVDVRIPTGWDGLETIKQLWLLDDDMQIVICTAYSDYSWEETINKLGHKDNLLILKKPFDSIAVRQLACALTKKWQLVNRTRHYSQSLEQQICERTQSLEKSLSLVKATLESSSNGIMVLDSDGCIVDYNLKFISMWKIPRSNLKRLDNSWIIEHMKDQLIEHDQIDQIFCNQTQIKSEVSLTNCLHFKDGRIYEYDHQPQIVNNVIVGSVYDFRNMTKRLNLEKKLAFQATHDALTGLANRVLLMDHIQSEISQSQAKRLSFAVLFIDLDRFKLINDSLSHNVGDEVLKITGSRLSHLMRGGDLVARLGGDEFVVVLSAVDAKDDVVSKIQKIQDAFKSTFNIGGRDLMITSSIGVSMYPDDGDTADILLRNADAAMYRAKEVRGNSYEFYMADLNNQCLAKLDQEVELRNAIKNNEFFLCYQPQIDIQYRKVIAVEALIRWRHPQYGVLLPLDFIPLAEETGLILSIGEWVLREACRQNVLWQKIGLAPMRVAVNVVAQQFTHQDFVGMIQSVLSETQLDPHYLELELTENVIVTSPEIIRALTELKKMGVTIAIDDFGTGYSSLSYLKKIPLNRLKIDGSFVQNIQTSTDDEVIIRAIIAMARHMNLDVLAEGVENQDQFNFLKVNSCNDAQGYYMSKPLTGDEMVTFIQNIERQLAQVIDVKNDILS